MPLWLEIVTGVVITVVAGIILLFLLPILEPTKQKFLGLIGAKSVKEQAIVKPELPVSDKPVLQTALVPSPEANKPVPERTVGPAVDPGQIYSAIKSAPLLQQEEVAKHFIGVKVEWSGNVAIIKVKPTGMIWIVANWNDQLMRSFEFEVNPPDCPGIGLLKDHDVVRVRDYQRGESDQCLVARRNFA